FITDRGRPAHVLITIEEYQKLTGGPMTLADALAQTEASVGKEATAWLHGRPLARRKTLPIVTRRNSQSSYERSSHLLFTAVATPRGDGFDAALGLFETPPSLIEANRFHRLRGSPTPRSGVHTGKIAGTHVRPRGQ